MDESKKPRPQHLDYKKMSGTELKGRIRQINRLLVKVRSSFTLGLFPPSILFLSSSNPIHSLLKSGLDAELVASKQKQLKALQSELATRPPSHIVVQENIRRIKENNQHHKLKNSTISYIGALNSEFTLQELHNGPVYLVPPSSITL